MNAEKEAGIPREERRGEAEVSEWLSRLAMEKSHRCFQMLRMALMHSTVQGEYTGLHNGDEF